MAQDASAEATQQIDQMKKFILSEAQDKAEEIESKAKEEFETRKLTAVQNGRQKIKQDMELRSQKRRTQAAIDASTKLNNQRLAKIKRRNEILDTVQAHVAEKLKAHVDPEKKEYETLLRDLVVQGALLLQEKAVTVQTTERDAELVKSNVLAAAQDKFTEVVKEQTGKTRSVAFDMASTSLGPEAVGGVLLMTEGGAIKVDNTLHTRMMHELTQDKPAIRELLFPAAK